jgi:Flp pilus assembly protein TadD
VTTLHASPTASTTPATTTSAPFALRLAWARGLFERQDFTAAAAALAELLAEAEHADAQTLHGTTDLRLLLARAYFGSAQLGRAEATLRQLVDEAPTDGYVHLLLGRTLQRQGRHDDARRHLSLAALLGDYERPIAYGDRASTD